MHTEPEPYRLTASEALQLIRTNNLTVETYARSLLSRIDARDDLIKAWAYLDPDAVLAQARTLDSVPEDRRGPLHGLAVGVKDIIYTKDMPTQHNSPLYKDSHPIVDAASVSMLRSAGALILGKTTTTEFAAITQGTATTNPHDPSRTPGGSSSGSAAAVADLHVPVSLGTQTGGSTIRPASFTGVYALKPTWNAVSREGQKMYAAILDTLGVFARCAEDLGLLGEVFGLDGSFAEDVPAGFSLVGARFGFVRTSAWAGVGEGTVHALQSARVLLEKHGAVVEEVDLPAEFDRMAAWHATVMAADARVAFLPEYRADSTKLNAELVAHVENEQRVSRAQLLDALDGMAMLRPVIDGIAGRYAALLTASVPDEAPVGLESTGSPAFNTMWTALHTPVVNIPGFNGAHGLPIGISLVAPRYRDSHLIQVAVEVGKIFEGEGGWKSAL